MTTDTPTGTAELVKRLEAMENALREFPHFEDGSAITPDRIKRLAREYVDMIMGWEPSKTETVFIDQDGNDRDLIFESGEVHEPGGWTIPEDADWIVVSADAIEAAERVITQSEKFIADLRPDVLNPHVTDNYFGEMTSEGMRLKAAFDDVLAGERDWLASHATGQRKGGDDD